MVLELPGCRWSARLERARYQRYEYEKPAPRAPRGRSKGRSLEAFGLGSLRVARDLLVSGSETEGQLDLKSFIIRNRSRKRREYSFNPQASYEQAVATAGRARALAPTFTGEIKALSWDNLRVPDAKNSEPRCRPPWRRLGHGTPDPSRLPLYRRLQPR